MGLCLLTDVGRLVAADDAVLFRVFLKDGTSLVYNRPDPYLPDLLICRPELAERVIAAAAGV